MCFRGRWRGGWRRIWATCCWLQRTQHLSAHQPYNEEIQATPAKEMVPFLFLIWLKIWSLECWLNTSATCMFYFHGSGNLIYLVFIRVVVDDIYTHRHTRWEEGHSFIPPPSLNRLLLTNECPLIFWELCLLLLAFLSNFPSRCWRGRDNNLVAWAQHSAADSPVKLKECAGEGK